MSLSVILRPFSIVFIESLMHSYHSIHTPEHKLDPKNSSKNIGTWLLVTRYHANRWIREFYIVIIILQLPHLFITHSFVT